MCNCTGDKCQICGSCQCDDCSNACRCGSLFDSSESSSSKSRKEYAEASAHLGDFAEGSCDDGQGYDGGDEPRRPGLRKVLFAVIIICVMVLVGVLTLTILEHTNVIVWDQTKSGVESWTTWGQYLAIVLSVAGIVGFSVLRWKAGQPEKLKTG
jgi:hypothetical protein